MEQAIQTAVQKLLADQVFWVLLGCLAIGGYIVNRAVGWLAEAQGTSSDRLAQELRELSKKVEALEFPTLQRVMFSMEREVGHRHGESYGEMIERWLDYRHDLGRSSPIPDENDALAWTLEEVMKDEPRAEPGTETELP